MPGRIRGVVRVGAVTVAVAVSLAVGCTHRGSDHPAGCSPGTPVDEARMSVIALDAGTGSVRWRHDDVPFYANGYTHMDGRFVVVSRGMTGESFDVATGEPGPTPPGTVPVPVTVGARHIDASIPAGVRTAALWDTALVAGDDAVVIDDDGVGNGALVGFDPTTTTRRWSFALDRPTHSSLLLQDGIVVVTTADRTPGCA